MGLIANGNRDRDPYHNKLWRMIQELNSKISKLESRLKELEKKHEQN